MSVAIREAVEEDVLLIQHFISKAGVQLGSVPLDWKQFIVAEDGQGAIAATAALQPVTDTSSLIRALVIDSEKVGASFVLKMLETAVQYAWEKKNEEIYMMVKEAGEMMENLGFKKVEKEDLPVEITVVPEIFTHLENGLPVYKASKPVDKR
ncbi:hypothetical protein K8O68_08525 [Salipaludibacillus sp. CUR1]|uniref:GNAT family N-acetyltransferase n=1 Tax=Salipaludibacillus sp. CUR1 TaxID=2820003 RepID=UPI001E630E33|nr:hypothetical protein [Salipaludibacillus sp. CUR1]MCE7792460.1 hypothetical protein [Salipaludibacillus sp. CUR1]